jgi:ABC-type glutathione transport system ATPase component
VNLTATLPRRGLVGEKHSIVALEVCPGEGVGIIGPSGAGKTTLLEALAASAIKTGSHRLAYLPQNPRDLFPSQLTARTLFRALSRGHREPGRYDAICREFLDALGLHSDSVIAASSQSLSGGEVQRAAIAGLLAMEPALLLADEPSASLDERSKSELARLLRRVRAKHDLALVVASHDIEFIRQTCDRVFRICETGIEEAILEDVTEAPRSDHPELRSEAAVTVVVSRHEKRPAPLAKPRTIISGFRHSFHARTVHGVAGPSGIGKSTLLRIVAGHEKPSKGKVVNTLAAENRPRALVVPQDPRLFFDPLRSMADHAMLLAGRTSNGDGMTELFQVLDQLALHDASLLRRKPNEVSGGEAHRLALGVALWLKPALICLDEIDAGVPLAIKPLIAKAILESVRASGAVALVASHDRSFLTDLCHEIIDLRAS